VLAGGRLWILLSGSDAQHDILLALDPLNGATIARLVLPTNDGRALAPARTVPMVMTATGRVLVPQRLG
jgi:hypothetical protein